MRIAPEDSAKTSNTDFVENVPPSNVVERPYKTTKTVEIGPEPATWVEALTVLYEQIKGAPQKTPDDFASIMQVLAEIENMRTWAEAQAELDER
ncbi:MAG: hypothetical protein GY748_23305 [Planctomycetaceae bacterium]|nr:hypothetical protein [Planctomycetaceae bacterium]